MTRCLINIWKAGDKMNDENTDLTIENTMTAYLSTPDTMIKPIQITILYTGGNLGKTLSLIIDDKMITLDYNALKKKVGDINE
jgi:hypothetical protein